jgi:hypothetical protein
MVLRGGGGRVCSAFKKISTNKPKKTSVYTAHGHLALSKPTILKYQHTILICNLYHSESLLINQDFLSCNFLQFAGRYGMLSMKVGVKQGTRQTAMNTFRDNFD